MSTPLQRYKLTIAYKGTRYHGWQRQNYTQRWHPEGHEAGDEAPTVQGLLTVAVRDVVKHPVDVVGSSRTDSGVHAKAQVAHFDTHMTQIPPEGLRRAVNSRLPGDILVRTIEPVDGWFHAIRSTVEKRYQYAVWTAYDRPPFFSDMIFHRWQAIDVDLMRQAAVHLVGRHDFNAFARPGHGRADTVRELTEISITGRGPRLVIGVAGSGFLWNTVRIISGTLIEVGTGRMRPTRVAEALESRDRRMAGPTAPAHGLFLQWIKFGRRQITDAHDDSPPVGSESDS